MCVSWSSGGSHHNCTSDFTITYSDPMIGTFEWALTQLKSGHSVRRKIWTDSTAHIYISKGATQVNDEIRTVGQDEVGKNSAWHPYEHHLLATDWRIYVKRCGSCGQPTS